MAGTGSLATITHLPAPGRAAWDFEVAAFMQHLRAKRRSPNTLTAYAYALTRFRESMERHGRDLDPAGIAKADILAFQIDQEEAGARPASQASRWASVRSFVHYLIREEVITGPDPFRTLDQPTIPEDPTPVAPAESIRALLAVTGGRDFLARRDHALIAFMVDAGVRREEVVGMLMEDVDLDGLSAWVHGKGERPRLVRFSDDTGARLRSYVRLRERHKRAAKVESRGSRADNQRRGRPFWLGDARTGRGGIGLASVQRILEARCAEAGIPHLHPHQLRHTWAHGVKARGMAPEDMMVLGGWRDARSLARYGKAEAATRAAANYLSPMEAILDPRTRKGRTR